MVYGTAAYWALLPADLRLAATATGRAREHQPL